MDRFCHQILFDTELKARFTRSSWPPHSLVPRSGDLDEESSNFMLRPCYPRSRLNACAGRRAETPLVGAQSRLSCRDVGLQTENPGTTDEAIGARGAGHDLTVLRLCIAYCEKPNDRHRREADRLQNKFRKRKMHRAFDATSAAEHHRVAAVVASRRCWTLGVFVV